MTPDALFQWDAMEEMKCSSCLQTGSRLISCLVTYFAHFPLCVCVGGNCSVNIDECESDPCQYNGTCVDLVNSYRCECIPGITGSNCETNIDDCQSAPCLHGGRCNDLINGYYICACSVKFPILISAVLLLTSVTSFSTFWSISFINCMNLPDLHFN